MSTLYPVINGKLAELKAKTLHLTRGYSLRARFNVDPNDPPTIGDRIGLVRDSAVMGARTFNGTSSVLARMFASSTTDNWTIGVWARAASVGAQRFALCIGTAANGYGIYQTADGYWQGVLSGVWTLGGTTSPVVIGEDVLLVVRRSGGNSQLFVGGLPMGSTYPGAPVAPNGYITVGCRRNGANTAFEQFFHGQLSHAFLAFVALTDAQILALAQGGPGGMGIALDRIATGTYWYYPIRGTSSPERDTAATTSLGVTNAPATTNGPLVLSASGTIFMHGEIEQARIQGQDGEPLPDLMECDVTAVDYQDLLPSRFVLTLSRPAETLKARLTAITNATLAAYGVTVLSSQDDGPTLEARNYDAEPLSDVLYKLANAHQRVMRIDGLKRISILAPSASVAPFDIEETTSHLRGDVSVEPTRANYANKVIFRAGDAKVVEKTESFTGTGSTATFALSYPHVGNRGYVIANGVFETLGIGAQWSMSGNNLVRNGGNLPNGHVVTIVYDAQFPIVVTATDSAHATAPVEVLVENKNIYDRAAAQDEADKELALRVATTKIIRYKTDTDGLERGMRQHITESYRGLDDDVVITDISGEELGDLDTIRWSVTAVTGADYSSLADRKRSGSAPKSALSGGAQFVLASVGQQASFEFVQVPYDASYFTAAAGTWIVPGGLTYRVAIIGKVAIVQAFLLGTTISDTGTAYVAIKLPFTTTAGGTFFYKSSLSDGIGVVNGDHIELYRPSAGWMTPEHVYVSFIVPMET